MKQKVSFLSSEIWTRIEEAISESCEKTYKLLSLNRCPLPLGSVFPDPTASLTLNHVSMKSRKRYSLSLFALTIKTTGKIRIFPVNAKRIIVPSHLSLPTMNTSSCSRGKRYREGAGIDFTLSIHMALPYALLTNCTWLHAKC